MARSLGRIASLGLHVAVPPLALAVCARAVLYQRSLGRLPRLPLSRRAEATGIAGLHDVDFESEPGVTIRGWHRAPKNGAAVILSHGSDANREQLMPELSVLTDAGFGVLAFDWPGQGESGGHLSWGRGERLGMQAAVTFLERRGEHSRLGTFGFSFGGIFSAQVAALDRRVNAVALAATPHALDEQRRWVHRRWGLLSQTSGLLAAHLLYGPQGELEPVRVIDRVSPRPLLLIAGGADQTVPQFMTDALFGAAREPKSLYVVPGAGHGDFDRAAPADYTRTLREFFERSLL